MSDDESSTGSVEENVEVEETTDLSNSLRDCGISREEYGRVVLSDERIVGSSIRYLVDVF
eukprot:scaffold31208_cov94-Skeletonema_dohrnii-CCMP3373.AAC.1